MRDTNIRITPFELLDVIEYRGVKKENEHGYVVFSGHIDESLEDTYVEMSLEDLWAEATAVDDQGATRTLFFGVVTDLKVRTQNGVKLLSGIIRSGSYLMDTMPHIRSYQENSMQYKTVLSSFTKNYPNGQKIMTKGVTDTIEKFILQYRETDWEFTKRLATHFRTIVMPDCKTQGVKYFFGLPDLTEVPVIDTKFYAMEKRMDEYLCKKKNGLDGIRESDAIYYIIKRRDIYELGGKVILNGRELFISEIRTELEGSELYHTYYLKSENGFKVPQAFNTRAIGASLYSKILATMKDVVQVSIDEDENKAGCGVRWFPYSTVYSTPDGTGWYCMPEIGDAVRVYVPKEDEPDAYVISSTHLEPSAGDERVNPDYKSIMNKQGKEILFTPTSLTITNNKGMSIELLDEEGIVIKSDKSIIIKADKAIQIASATDQLQTIAPEGIIMQQGETNLELYGNAAMKGDQIRLN